MNAYKDQRINNKYEQKEQIEEQTSYIRVSSVH